MAVERWLFDGWDIEQAGLRGWEMRDGTGVVPVPEGPNVRTYTRTGEIWRPKKFGASRFVLNLWIVAADRAAADAQFNLILRAVARPWEQTKVTRHKASGEIIECLAELGATIRPSFMGRGGWRAQIEFNVPSGVWEEPTTRTFTATAGATLPKTLTLTALAESTAPNETGVFTIYGPITNPRIVETTGGVDGDWFQYNGTVPNNQALIVNSGTWALAGLGGFVPNQSLAYSSNDRFMPIHPGRPGQTPTVQLRGTSGGTATNLHVSARRTYLV